MVNLLSRLAVRFASIFIVAALMRGGQLPADELDVWIGTTTPEGGPSKGIYHATFDADSGRLSQPQLAAEIDNPGFLARHPSLDVLYSTGRIDGQESVVAYRILRNNGQPKLRLLNSQPTGDGNAAHLDTDRMGSFLLSAQYDGGSTAIYPLAADGAIGERSQSVKHEGGSRVVADRQDAPHAHWVGASPDNRFVFVPDLGLDQVVIYELDTEHATLTPHSVGQTPPGSGPRHFKFHPNGKFAYVVNELALTVTVFQYDAQAGTLTPLQTIPTLSEEEKANETFKSGSEIRIHPSGSFVYAANRGHDSISVFRVDPVTSLLTFVEWEPVRGSHPRNFTLDPAGKWLLAAGRDSSTIAVFAIDQNSGALTYTHHSVSTPTPICVLFDAQAKGF